MSLLKFRYILIVFLVLSCGNDIKNKKNSASAKTNETAKKAIDASEDKIILFYGNSLTAGYGLDTEEAFPALIQNKLDSLGLAYTAINSGLSGETTSGGLNRLEWVLNQKVDVFVLELGANDGLRGLPLEKTRENLEAIIELVRKKNEDTNIILAGMQIPPNMGQAYTKEFKMLFPELAKEKNVQLIPFLLEGVAGIPSLNQDDGIHPTAEGQKIVRENVWSVLKEVIQEKNSSS